MKESELEPTYGISLLQLGKVLLIRRFFLIGLINNTLGFGFKDGLTTVIVSLILLVNAFIILGLSKAFFRE